MTMNTDSQKRAMKWWVLAVLIVLAVGTALFAATTILFADETTEEATFDLDMVAEIRTVTEAGHIDISAEDRGDIRVVAVLTSGFGSEPQSDVALENGVLSMDGRCRSLLIGNCRVTYRVTVPTDGALALALETAAGNIDVREHIGEEAELRTAAGNVSFEGSTPPTRLSIETTAGSITVIVPDVGYRIDAQTTVGSVRVDLDEEPNAERTIEASSAAGSIDIMAR